MADTESASAHLAEDPKLTTDQAHEPALQNGTETTQDEPKDVKAETSTDPKSVEITSEAQTAAGASEKSSEPASKSDPKENESPDRKRKHSPADDRDWRQRRDEDQRLDRDRPQRGGRDRSRSRDRYRDRDDRRGGRGGRGGGRGNYNNGERYSNNVRTKFDAQPESSDPDEIRKQVEFYFSDSNLPTDKFLLTQVGGSENKPVPVTVIHSFKRMRHFQPYSAVVAALRESSTLNIIGAEGAEEIQRKEPLPENTTADPTVNVTLFDDVTRTRSIYAKGFGEEVETTQFDIEEFFAPYGPINAVRLRRSFPDKTFKGSVFVEFDSDETAKQFLELENKPKWHETELKVMSKEKYVNSKAEDVKSGKVRSNNADRESDRRQGRGGGRGRGGRGRGGRGGGRGGRDRDRDWEQAERDRGRRPRDEIDEDGDEEDRPSKEDQNNSTEPNNESKKRTRDETGDVDGADTGNEVKKAKTDDADAKNEEA